MMKKFNLLNVFWKTKRTITRQKIVLKIEATITEPVVIIFGPERAVSKYVCIYYDEIVRNKVLYWTTIREKYETIIRRMKYNG